MAVQGILTPQEIADLAAVAQAAAISAAALTAAQQVSKSTHVVSGRRGGVPSYPAAVAVIKTPDQTNIGPDGVQVTTTLTIDASPTQADPSKVWQTNDVLVIESVINWAILPQVRTYTVLHATPLGGQTPEWFLKVEGAVR